MSFSKCSAVSNNVYQNLSGAFLGKNSLSFKTFFKKWVKGLSFEVSKLPERAKKNLKNIQPLDMGNLTPKRKLELSEELKRKAKLELKFGTQIC